jgi:GNAT superfamily N-acetyltransferase
MSQNFMMSQSVSVEPIIEFEFRIAKSEDLTDLLRLYQQLHPHEAPIQTDAQTLCTWKEILDDPRLYCFVIAQGSKLIASCVLDIVPNLTRGGRPFGVLQNVVTDEVSRGKGIGGKLIRQTLDFAWDKNCYQVLVQTGRPETVPFYCAQGFKDDSKIGLVAKPEWRPT